MGGWSDAIRGDLMAPDLRLTPLGDVHANFDFHDEVVMPHAQITAGNRITDDAEPYTKNPEDRPPQPLVEHRIADTGTPHALTQVTNARLVCSLLLEKKRKNQHHISHH